jgi:hypothetical protein
MLNEARWLLGGKLKMIIFFFFLIYFYFILFYFYNKSQGYFPNGLPNCIQAYETNMTKLRIYTPQTMCQCAYENQIEL